MPCDILDRQLTAARAAARRKARAAAVADLAKRLARKAARLVVDRAGRMRIEGWPESAREGMTDPCAYRDLKAAQPALAARLEAELKARGEAISETQLSAGTHSHDGGKTWGPGH